MVAEFLAGVIVGILIGLAVAPVLRAWVIQQTVRSIYESTRRTPSVPVRTAQD